MSKMCTEDPVSGHFSHKFHALFQTVILRGQLFREVVCYFIKKSAHVMLWIKDAPVIGVDPDHARGSLLDTGEKHVSHSGQEH